MRDTHYNQGRLLKQPDRSLWLLWPITYLTGYVVAVLIGISVAPIFERLTQVSADGQSQSWLVTPAMLAWATLLGAFIGALQWLVLRPYLPDLKWQRWTLATVLGLVAGLMWVFVCGGVLVWVLILRELYDENRATTPLVFTLIASVVLGGVGAILGATQQSVLRKYLIRAGRWLWVNTIASVAGGLLFGLVFMATRGSTGYFSFGPWYALAMGAVFFATLGIITGIMLYRMLREHDMSTP